MASLWATLCGFTAASAEQWPKFRGPFGDGSSPAEPAEIPLAWSPEQNVAWRTELPGEGWSSPVVVDGQVFLSAAIPTEDQDERFDLALLIVDAASGKLQTTARLMEQTPDQTPPIHSKNSHASPTLIVTKDRIYVHFGYQGTACTDRQGKPLWINRDLRFAPTHGNGGSPILVGDRLVFTCDGGDDPAIVALQADDGSVAWRTSRPVDAVRKFSFCTPTAIEVEGETQVIAPGSDCVLALDPDDGAILWQVNYSGFSVVPKPLYVDGQVLVATGFMRPSLLAIDPRGRGDVTETHVDWAIKRGIPKTPSLITYAGRIFFVSDEGIAACVDQQTGRMLWKERLGGGFSASPVRVGNRIYMTNEAGVTTVIEAADEFKPLAENDLAERTLASPAVAAPAVYLRTAEALYRIENSRS